MTSANAQLGAHMGRSRMEQEGDASPGTAPGFTPSDGDPCAVLHGKPNFGQLTLEDRGLSTAEAASVVDMRVARWMWYGGFALLPWMWFIAWSHFRKAARSPAADPMLATYVHRCGAGAAVGAAAFAAWLVYVNLAWTTWGDFGRSIMVVAPDDLSYEL